MTTGQVPTKPFRRVRPGDIEILVRYQCAALAAVIAKTEYHERADPVWLRQVSCGEAHQWAKEMFRQSGF